MMKLVVCSILKPIFIILISAALGTTGVSVTNWQFWAIVCSAIGLYGLGGFFGRRNGIKITQIMEGEKDNGNEQSR